MPSHRHRLSVLIILLLLWTGNLLVARGMPSTTGMLIDTARNGWGGPDRPAAVSTATDINTYVDESRTDRRLHRGNWCNQPGGIGERPRANPAPNIDAYIWAWPPGLSDGISHQVSDADPPAPGLQFNPMCDPGGTSLYNSAYSTGAMKNAPLFGRMNPPHLDMLVQHAYPPL